MASSPHKHHHHQSIPNPTSAPPPTPSAHNNLLSTSEAADAFSGLLHRLTPTLTLSLPARRSSPSATTKPPIITLSDPTETLHSSILSASSQLGFFQLTHHSIPSQLAHSAELESLSLFNLSHREKQLYFPKNWPMGYDAQDDDHDNDDEESATSGANESFCLDSCCSAESTELGLTSLREFTAEMEKVGLEVVEALSGAYGFANPARQDATQVCSLMWISQGSTESAKPEMSGRMYPYVVGLHYQIHPHRCLVLTDSGWASIAPEVDSVLVTLGDIAQVWSNGKLKKVRGRPVVLPNAGAGANNSQHSISMTMLITLPIDGIVSPLLPKFDIGGHGDDEMISHEEDDGSCSNTTTKEERMFNSFSFEDYAWRIYHERLHSKDPLIRYRV